LKLIHHQQEELNTSMSAQHQRNNIGRTWEKTLDLSYLIPEVHTKRAAPRHGRGRMSRSFSDKLGEERRTG